VSWLTTRALTLCRPTLVQRFTLIDKLNRSHRTLSSESKLTVYHLVWQLVPRRLLEPKKMTEI
jgi:hypothetical protein